MIAWAGHEFALRPSGLWAPPHAPTIGVAAHDAAPGEPVAIRLQLAGTIVSTVTAEQYRALLGCPDVEDWEDETLREIRSLPEVET